MSSAFPHNTLFIVFSTSFLWWALHELLERKLGMAPKITTVEKLQKLALKNKDPQKSLEMNMRYYATSIFHCLIIHLNMFHLFHQCRLSKAIDENGQYRTQIRSAVRFTKTIYEALICFSVSSLIIAYPDWAWEYFIELNGDSARFEPFLHLSAVVAGFYCWEVAANRYGKLSWPTLLHHWLSVIMAAALAMEIYIPFAWWYGFTGMSMAFPMSFMLGFRTQYSFRYPEFTRKGLVMAKWWYIFIMTLNFSGQIFLILNTLLYHYNESIHLSMIIVVIICFCCFLYDDYNLLRALHAFSKQQYELADFLSPQDHSIEKQLTVNVIQV